MSYTIYISNTSKFISSSDFNSIVTACNALLPTFCTHWNITCPLICQSPIKTSIKLPNLLLSLIDCNIDNLLLKNEIEVKPILENGGVVLYKDDVTLTVASFVFSAICNLSIDSNLNGWWIDLKSDLNNPIFYANEVCDQVQNNIVKVTVGNSNSKNGVVVGLSDFILPAWKDLNSKCGPFNYMNTLKVHFEYSEHGSIIKFTPSQGITQVFGKNTSNWLQNLKNKSYKYNARKLFKKQ